MQTGDCTDVSNSDQYVGCPLTPFEGKEYASLEALPSDPSEARIRYDARSRADSPLRPSTLSKPRQVVSGGFNRATD